MKKEIYLQIPEPCHQNWDTMTTVAKGRFCESCKKEVVDFSVMTDKEILRVISKSSNGTCARVSSDQLDKPLIKETIPVVNPSRFFLSAFIPAFLFAGKASSQNKLKADVVSVVKTNPSYNMVGGIRPYSPQSITGSITLSDGTPAANAMIIIVETGKETMADKYGRFSISYPMDKANVTIQALAKGYYSKEVDVDRDKIKPLHIKLVAPEIMIGKTAYAHSKVEMKNVDTLSHAKVIYGKAQNQNGEALANATIHVNSINKSFLSGSDGRFTIPINRA